MSSLERRLLKRELPIHILGLMQLSNHTTFYGLGTKDIASPTIYGMRQVSKQQMVLLKKSPAVASRAFLISTAHLYRPVDTSIVLPSSSVT